MDMKQKRITQAFIGILFLLIAYYLFKYLRFSNDEMPFMDFWVNFDIFAEKVFEKQLSFSDYFPIPHPLHWGAFLYLTSVLWLKLFAGNNLAYIYAGMAFCLANVGLVLWFFLRKIANESMPFNIGGAFTCALAVVNLNQWEILDYCSSKNFMIRIFLYLISFWIIDNYLNHSAIPNQKSWAKALGIGLCGVFIIFCCSAAYYPGYVAAICGVILLHVLLKKGDITNIKQSVVLMALLLGGAVLTMETTDFGVGVGNVANGETLGFGYIKEFIVMLGSTVIPQTKGQECFELYYIVGVVILMTAIASLVIFFKEKLYQRTWFPIECLVYAGTSIVVIVFGRSKSFGLATLTSSRYVVETTLGLLGIIQICLLAISNKWNDRKKSAVFEKTVAVVVVVAISLMIIYSDLVEYRIGPYRGALNRKMIALAMDIDDASDAELSVFQTSPNNVRSGITAMKKYHLGLWNEKSKYYQTQGIRPTSDAWDDGWIGPNAKFYVHLADENAIHVSGWYGGFSDSGEEITVVVKGHDLMHYRLNSTTIDFDVILGEGYEGNVKILSNFSNKASPPDVRIISFVLNGISGEKINLTNVNARADYGVYNDNWVAPLAGINVKTGESGIVHLSGWFRDFADVGEIITVYCNGVRVAVYALKSQNISFDIQLFKNENVFLELESNFEAIVSPPDVRRLAFILSSIGPADSMSGNIADLPETRETAA